MSEKGEGKKMKQLFEQAKKTMDCGESFVFITIISSSGSTPRGSGSRMLLTQTGLSLGTIGGGNLEFYSIQCAKQVLEKRISGKREFALGAGENSELGMICGGHAVVYFQYIDRKNQEFYRLCEVILNAYEREEDSWFLLDLTDEAQWKAGFYSESTGFLGMEPRKKEVLLDNHAVFVNASEQYYYSEPLVHAGRVYVFGGGHVAQELVPLLSHVGFRCVVFDDRPEFSNKQLFPDAKETIIGDFKNVFESITVDAQDYVCIMSRGHEYDYLLQKQMLQTEAHYIGVMGSRRKIQIISEKLLEDGFEEADIKRFFTPIGLEIYAQTPAEIAVSVAAELIRIRAVREGRKK